MSTFFDFQFSFNLSKFILSTLFGSMIFFSAIVAPNVFKTLDSINSRKFIRSLFPKLYLWGIILSSLNCLLILDHSNLVLIVSFSVLVGFVISRQTLMPMINNASDTKNDKKFRLLHSLSVLIFLLQLFAIIFLIVIQK